jgi:hypothetical protein
MRRFFFSFSNQFVNKGDTLGNMTSNYFLRSAKPGRESDCFYIIFNDEFDFVLSDRKTVGQGNFDAMVYGNVCIKVECVHGCFLSFPEPLEYYSGVNNFEVINRF